MLKTQPFGTWRSPITAATAAEGNMRLSEVQLDGPDVYWLEMRPNESGRYALVRLRGDDIIDVIPPDVSVRTAVHEYGGGAYDVREGVIVYSDWSDHRLYRLDPDGETSPITPEPESAGQVRYADMVIRGDWVYCVRETHSSSVRNDLVAVPLMGGDPVVLAEGKDFYSFPRPDAEGSRIAWTSWDAPNMPWDGTELWVADLAGSELRRERMVAGGASESIFQPSWSPDGDLVFVSDVKGWWNLFAWDGAEVRCLLEMEAEFGTAQWQFGFSWYDFLEDGGIIATFARHGAFVLGKIEPGAAQPDELPTECGPSRMPYLKTRDGMVFYIGGSPLHPLTLVRYDLAQDEEMHIRDAGQVDVDPSYLSVPKLIEYPTAAGESARAWFYPPTNPDFEPEPGEKPPAIVTVHGGPTSQARTYLELEEQFWTSRGFVFIDVDYRGSTGYGRGYRDALKGGWGKVDLEDVVAVVEHLSSEGEIDPERVAIRGGSAGGYTTLCALAFTDSFRAGANYYGVADLMTFLDDTHKFEAHYLDTLVGPYPESEHLYRERSPVHFIDQIRAPMVVFQGSEDKIVPPSQSEQIVQALKRQGIEHVYLEFPGEHHGFRKAENIAKALEVELAFYGRVLGFEPADATAPIEDLIWSAGDEAALS